jgi:hypothetical protein
MGNQPWIAPAPSPLQANPVNVQMVMPSVPSQNQFQQPIGSMIFVEFSFIL